MRPFSMERSIKLFRKEVVKAFVGESAVGKWRVVSWGNQKDFVLFTEANALLFIFNLRVIRSRVYSCHHVL